MLAAGLALEVSVLVVVWGLFAGGESVVLLIAVSPPILLLPALSVFEPPRKSVTYQPEPFN